MNTRYFSIALSRNCLKSIIGIIIFGIWPICLNLLYAEIWWIHDNYGESLLCFFETVKKFSQIKNSWSLLAIPKFERNVLWYKLSYLRFVFRQALAKDLEDARQASRTAQKKMTETASELYQSRQQNKELESENNRLQNKLKDLNEEYKSRLVRYVDDIAVSRWSYSNHRALPDMLQCSSKRKSCDF